MKPGPALLVVAGLAVVALGAAMLTPADADLWGHLAFGRDILDRWSIVQPDRYSFTSDKPWVNHEWLAEMIFFAVYRAGGPTGLILLKTAMIAAVAAIVGWRARLAHAPAAAIVSLVALALVGTYWRTHSLRPQLFSVVVFALLLFLIAQADAGRRRALILVPPLMALWVNLHGGWIVGLGALGVWVGGRLLDRRSGPPGVRERVGLAVLGVAAVAATLLNPYGTRLWMFLAETVRFDRADIQDWGPILAFPVLLGVPWALAVGAGAFALWRSGGARRIEYVAIAAGLAAASFRVSRLDAFLTLAVVILLAPEIVHAWNSFAPDVHAGSRPGRLRSSPVPALAITGFAFAAMVIPAAVIVRPYLTCVTIGGSWGPPEAEAGTFIAKNHLRGRMLTWYDWGEYAIWHFGPALQVSMDGRRETVYSEAMIQAHRRFYAGNDLQPFLRDLNPDYVWLPRSLPVTNALARNGWVPIFTGPVSRIFARAESGPFQQVAASTPAMRCFPGP